jgi:hypothetical protein
MVAQSDRRMVRPLFLGWEMRARAIPGQCPTHQQYEKQFTVTVAGEHWEEAMGMGGLPRSAALA